MILENIFQIVAQQQRIDVVLVDTAGRMQNNEPLMRSLAKVNFIFLVAKLLLIAALSLVQAQGVQESQ